MGTVSFLVSFWLSATFLCLYTDADTLAVSKREALEIIIGGVGGEEDPPPPPPPKKSANDYSPLPALSFENKRLEHVYHVIQDLKEQISGDPKGYTDTWVGTDVCSYKGLRCETYPGTTERAVSGYDFNEAGFCGPNLNLFGLLDDLPDTTYFHANSNNFTASVPFEITRFIYFYEIDLSNNKLVGEFPKAVLGSKNLTFIDLRYNSFHGRVPPELFTLDVDVIFINHNNFNQELPDNFGSTPALYLTFASNQFTGRIPCSIGKAHKLKEVLFLNNSFSGCLPYEIGYLKNATVFDVSINQLTGPIPQSFSCLKKIQYLNLAQNSFYGSVLEKVCKLPNLVKLTLSGNYFNWVGPECLKLVHTRVLDISKNCIPNFPDQRSKYECDAFYSKPRYCSNAKSFSYIPCDTSNQNWKKTPDPPAAPVTYKALEPHY